MFQKVIFLFFLILINNSLIAEDKIPQVVTSEVFYKDASYEEEVLTQENDKLISIEKKHIPSWPIEGTEADVRISCKKDNSNLKENNNLNVVSNIGSDVHVANTFNFSGQGWSGGASMLHGLNISNGFYDECNENTEMPLLKQEMLEDDGGEIISVSKSNNKRCYAKKKDNKIIKEEFDKNTTNSDKSDLKDDKYLRGRVRSWVVASGQNLREVLKDWCNKEGWDLVWETSREYPIEASAVFKGRFVDVSSALVRNFSRANPIPYAKFYKGNRVLVISVSEE